MWVQAVRYDLFSSAVFLPYFSMLILSLPLLGLGPKSTSLSPRFCIRRPRQHNTICWKLNVFLISGFFAFSWLIVWADGINKCGWPLAGGRGWWLKGPHQIPSVSWIFHNSLHFHIYQILIWARNSLSIILLLWMMEGWDRWGEVVASYQSLGGGTGDGYYLLVCFLFVFTYAFVFWSRMSCLFFKWVEHDSCCVCFFVYYLFSLSLVPLTRSYWSMEIVSVI